MRHVGGLDGYARPLEGIPHPRHVGRGRDHLERSVGVANVFGTGIQCGQHHRLFVSDGGDVALLLEEVADRTRFAEIAVVAGHRGSHVGCRPVPVVGEDVDVHGHPTGTVSLVPHL